MSEPDKGLREEVALLPCPFCGGAAEISQIGNEFTPKRGFMVQCQTWGCKTTKRSMVIRQPIEKARSYVIEAWNTRAPALSLSREGGRDLANYLHDQALLAESEAANRVGGQRNRLLAEAADCRRWSAALSASPLPSGVDFRVSRGLPEDLSASGATAPSPNDLLRRGHVTSLLILAAAINGDMALEGGENARVREGMEAALTRARHAVAALEAETTVAELQAQRDALLEALKAIRARCYEVERKAPDALEDIWNLAKNAMEKAEAQ